MPPDHNLRRLRGPRRHARRAPADGRHGPLRIGIGGPVGSGKTALVAALCRALGDELDLAVVTNDIYTTEDADFLRRHAVLPDDRIAAVQTGCCPHTAIRDDITANLDAVASCSRRGTRALDLVLVESGGDNLTATFSYGLVDVQIFVIDVAGGDKVPRKGGPGVTARRPARDQQDRPRAAGRRRPRRDAPRRGGRPRRPADPAHLAARGPHGRAGRGVGARRRCGPRARVRTDGRDRRPARSRRPDRAAGAAGERPARRPPHRAGHRAPRRHGVRPARWGRRGDAGWSSRRAPRLAVRSVAAAIALPARGSAVALGAADHRVRRPAPSTSAWSRPSWRRGPTIAPS